MTRPRFSQGSAAGPRGQAAYTLIEILVVLLIIGIAAGGIAIRALPDERDRLRQEAERLGYLLEQARDTALMTGHGIAWTHDKAGYAFARRNAQGGWDAIAGDAALRPRALPQPVRLEQLRIAQVAVPLDTPLAFSPSGLNPDFTATLSAGEARVRLRGHAFGPIEVDDAP